jgi:hypothetical protein
MPEVAYKRPMTKMPPKLDGTPREGIGAGDPLATQVRRMVNKGWRVESQTEEMAVMVKGKRPNHVLHLILTVLTAGLWGIVWIILAITSHEDRMVLTAS